MNVKPARIALAARIALLGGAALPASALMAQDASTSPEENWQKMEACATIDRAAERHACMDEVLRRAGLLTRERELAGQRETFGQQPRREEEEREEVAEEIAAAPVVPEPPEEIDELQSSVAFAKLVARGYLLVVTEEGAVWRQTSGERVRLAPDPGTRFTVSKAALGSFRCKIGSSTIYRCERLD